MSVEQANAWVSYDQTTKNTRNFSHSRLRRPNLQSRAGSRHGVVHGVGKSRHVPMGLHTIMAVRNRSTICTTRRLLLICGLPLTLIFVVRNLKSAGIFFPGDDSNDEFDFLPDSWVVPNTTLPQQAIPSLADLQQAPPSITTLTETVIPSSIPKKKVTIAYAVSITKCNLSGRKAMLDGAAVVHQSIRLASRESEYDYHMIAFVHPEAVQCEPIMRKLGYEIQIRETPFNETAIPNPVLQKAQSNGCCGFKEYLKLYSYVQFDYPVVVHLDLDSLVLKPMDEVFDLMLDPSYNRSRISAMWLKPEEFPEQIDFVFTRDYNSVDPPKRQPHQIGTQGGFLVIRPNQTDFDAYIDIITSGGDFSSGAGWGGRKHAYGGYYGSATIQGLASYYYGRFHPHRAVELNRCYYNTMVDNPYNRDGDRCRTLQSNLTCQDCRKTDLKDVYTAHFTLCGKPERCTNPAEWWISGGEEQIRLCMELFREWHLVRRSLENEWKSKYPDYNPEYHQVKGSNTTRSYYTRFSQGHCRDNGSFIKMTLPGGFDNDTDETLL
jgi:hypothetical protein